MNIAVEVGRAARRALSPGRRGTVIARFERSFYVATGGGLACIGAPGLGHGPLNVLVPGLADLPRLHERVICAKEGVQFESGLLLPIQGAVVWRPVPAPPWRRGSLLRLKPIFPTEAKAFALWIASGATTHPPEAAARLIGLGTGLTPAGDDLIGGALIALHAVGRKTIAARIARWALRQAKTRTNRISLAHLQCAAAGEGHAALHRGIDAVLAGRRNLERELAALQRIGHSSGMDAFCGALVALDALQPQPVRRPSGRGT